MNWRRRTATPAFFLQRTAVAVCLLIVIGTSATGCRRAASDPSSSTAGAANTAGRENAARENTKTTEGAVENSSEGPMANRTAEPMARELSHEDTLKWINQHRAWRLARKTKPMWVREVGPAEADKEFQTADRAIEKPKPGHLLCVGVAGEPWFQKAERVATRFELVGEEQRKFSFDSEPQSYRIYKPKESTRNWAARVDDPSIAGFTVRPNYDVEHPLYSPSGGFVVRDFCDDPYSANPDDVWLVQEPLFLSTYELLDDGDE